MLMLRIQTEAKSDKSFLFLFFKKESTSF